MKEREVTTEKTTHSSEEIAAAKSKIKVAVMVMFGGDLLGPALVGVEVSDEDAIRYLNGASVDELLRGAT